MTSSSIVRDEEINARHLYSALRLTVHMYDGRNGSTMTGSGTGFVVRGEVHGRKHKGYLVTNRHVLDPDFKKHTGRGVARPSETIRGDP